MINFTFRGELQFSHKHIRNIMKIGIIRERKVPPDSRVPMRPNECLLAQNQGFEVVVESSPSRCFKDVEYQKLGIPVVKDMSDCDVLMGVKEVPKDQLIPNKTYFFFSHTIKGQSYNMKLLQKFLDDNITMIDYETLTDASGKRIIAFGKFAGMVGAHNALWTYAQRTKTFSLPRMKDLLDYNQAKSVYTKTKFPPVKIILTGSGRVGSGAAEVLMDMGIKKVSPDDFLKKEYDEIVFAQIDADRYVKTRNNSPFEKSEFYKYPERYESNFAAFAEKADIFINGIYFDKRAPAFFTAEDMKSDRFGIKVIADVTCDIAPVSSVPSTLYATTIADPVFGYDPESGKAVEPFSESVIDVMSIDNLPNELPRDASSSFGKTFVKYILNELKNPNSELLARATITKGGKLTPNFQYLKSFLEKELTTS